jgi:hypothetical protein
MKQFWITIPLFTSLFIAGCGNNDETSDIINTEPPAPINTTETNQNKVVSPASNTETVPVINNQPVATAPAGLNPEHGKPGHRCDIAVGAPLDSKPTQPVANPSISLPANGQKSTPVISSPSVPPTVSAPATGPGLNPEHGKPGHRCDIAVGAPLNSAPAATNTQPAATITPSISPASVQPAPTPVTPVVNTDGAGLNPEHGKPGHRCDIAVGAPLNSKPKEN